MPTGTVIVTNALTKLGIVELGASISASDLAAGLSELNNQWQAWGIDEGLIFAVQTTLYALTGGTGTYNIGPGATAPFNVPAPARIYQAAFVTAGGRNELEIVDRAKFFSHNDPNAAAVAPDELYPDFNISPTTGFATLNLWPIPSVSAASLELEAAAVFTAWTASANYLLPQGYQDAIEWALAFRLIPLFQMIVPPQIAQTVQQEGIKSEQRLRQMNLINRKLPIGTEQLPPLQEAAAAKG